MALIHRDARIAARDTMKKRMDFDEEIDRLRRISEPDSVGVEYTEERVKEIRRREYACDNHGRNF
jgi:hypothetical protein